MEHPDISHTNKNQSRRAAAAAAKLNQKGEKMEIKQIILLSRKNKGENVPVTVVQFYDCSPDEHAKKLKQNGEDTSKWCITRRKPISSERGVNACRKAGDGTWEQKHTHIPIKLGDNEIGYRRYYVYKRGSDTTDWRLHEYEEMINTQEKTPEDKLKDEYVLCKLYKKKKSEGESNNNGKRKGGTSSSTSSQKKERPANQNSGSITQTSKENEGRSSSKFPARLAIEDIDIDSPPHFKLIRADEDYNKLTENQRRLLDTGDWMNDPAAFDEFLW